MTPPATADPAAARPPRRRGEEGYTLVLLMFGLAVMLVLMGAAAPSWQYIMQNEREEELYFRGNAIAQAIEEYQRKTGGTFPPDLKTLVDRKFLRKLYKDPMAKDGKWRLVRQGEIIPVSGGPSPGGSPRPGASPSPSRTGGPGGTGQYEGGEESGRSRLGALSQPAGTAVGPIAGVASTSTTKSLRIFNGRTRYDQWLFMAGQPRVLGRPLVPGGVPGLGAPGAPGPPGVPGTPPRPQASPLR